MVSMPSRFERALDGLADTLGPAVRCRELLAVPVEVEAELGGDNDAVADVPKRFADYLLIFERTIDLGGVEKRHAAFDRRADQGDPVSFESLSA